MKTIALLIAALTLAAAPASAGIYTDENGVMRDDTDHSFLDPETGHWTMDPEAAEACGCHYETDEDGQLRLVIDTHFAGEDGSDTSGDAGPARPANNAGR